MRPQTRPPTLMDQLPSVNRKMVLARNGPAGGSLPDAVAMSTGARDDVDGAGPQALVIWLKSSSTGVDRPKMVT